MSHRLSTHLAGADLELFALGGIYAPEHDTLFVADTHLGKDATFRQHGIPVPSGATNETLSRIAELLHESRASNLIILGDMFHARSSLSASVRESVTAFIEHHNSVRITLVMGNHDRHVGALDPKWNIEVIEPGASLGEITVAHHPTDLRSGASLLLCGHIHPAVRIGNRRDAFGKLPCFWHSAGVLVLPAIGDFTGTHVVTPKAADQIWLIVDDEIIENPSVTRS